MTGWTERLAEIDARARALHRAARETMTRAGALRDQVHGDGALDAVTKELMALAMGVQAGCAPCVAHHVRVLVGLGLGRAAMVEACGVLVQMGGGPGQARAAEALEIFDALAATRAQTTDDNP